MRPPWRLLAAVAAGGVVGSLLRWAAVEALPDLPGTLAVNVLGAFLLGLLVARRPSPAVRAFVGTGVLGGLTTFSAFAVQAVDASLPTGIAYVAGTLGLGLLAAEAGRRVA